MAAFSLSADGGDDDDTYMVPSAVKTGAWQLWVCAILYFAVGCGALLGFFHSIRRQGTFFRSSFLGVSATFCFLRGFLTTFYVPHWQHHMFWVYFAVYFMPIYLQYWTFSLLILFVIRCILVVRDREALIHRVLYPVYHVTHLVLFIVCIVVSKVAASNYSPDQTAEWDHAPSIYTGTLYLLLALVGIYYSYRSYVLLSLASPADRKEILQSYMVLIPVFFLIFFGRALWNITHYFNANEMQKEIGGWIRNKNTTYFDWAFLVFYMIFEIIPTALVVYIFSIKVPVPGTSVTPLPGGTPRIPKYGAASHGSYNAAVLAGDDAAPLEEPFLNSHAGSLSDWSSEGVDPSGSAAYSGEGTRLV